MVEIDKHPLNVTGRYYVVRQRDDPDGGGELCVETRLDSTRTHLARFHLDAARNWRPNYVGMFTDLPDGSQIEDKILPSAR